MDHARALDHDHLVPALDVPHEPDRNSFADRACAGKILGDTRLGGMARRGQGRLLPEVNLAFLTVANPPVVALYQLALVWFIVGWLAGPDRAAWLGHGWPAFGIGGWLAVVGGLYLLKAVASLAMVFATLGSIPATGGAGGIAGSLSPFAVMMKQPVWPLLLVGGVVAAIVEEVLYRGYLSRILEGTALGFWGGAGLSAVIWAGLHVYYPLGMQAVLVAMGVALSVARARTGSTYPGMVWHALNNTVALIALKIMG
jgi:uncharacterized protein